MKAMHFFLFLFCAFSRAQWSIFQFQSSRAPFSCCNGYPASMVGTTSGNLALFAGGLTSPAVGNVYNAYLEVDVYDTTTNFWSQSTLSVARSGMAAITVGNLTLFGGGFDDVTLSKVVDIFDYVNTSNFVPSTTIPRAFPYIQPLTTPTSYYKTEVTSVGSKVLIIHLLLMIVDCCFIYYYNTIYIF